MTMSKTDALVATMKANLKTSGNSRKALGEIARTMLNERDYETTYYGADGSGKKEVTTAKHVDAFRSAVADSVGSALHLDSGDVAKVADMQINGKTADAIIDVAQDIQAKYLETGRKLSLPTTDPDAARSSIQLVGIAEKTKDTSRITDGKMVPTGKTVTTFEHKAVKAKSTVYPWQKKVVEK